MRTSKIWFTIIGCIAGCTAHVAAIAQQPAPAVAPPPPQMEKLDEGEEPAITIHKPETEKKITEKREKGKVTEIKVQSGKSTYYLKPNEQAGAGLPGDAQSNANRAPQWQVLEFGRVQPPKEGDPNNTQVPPQPPAKPQAEPDKQK
jgi:hypothetical protein